MIILHPTGPPNGPPANVVAEAINTASIRLSWQPPMADLSITGYNISYHPVAQPNDMMSISTIETEKLITAGITPDTRFSFTVAAKNSLGVGPGSPPIIQRSYPNPPPPPQDPPQTPDDVEVTMTTIPFILPTIDTSLFRFALTQQ